MTGSRIGVRPVKFCPFCGSYWLAGKWGDAKRLICSDCKQEVPRRV